jgi:hypothetical protein
MHDGTTSRTRGRCGWPGHPRRPGSASPTAPPSSGAAAGRGLAGWRRDPAARQDRHVSRAAGNPVPAARAALTGWERSAVTGLGPVARRARQPEGA